MKLIYKFPSRSRPQKFFKCLENIQAMARHSDYEIHATLDENDHMMNTAAIRETLVGYERVTANWGRSMNKIHAVNRDMPVGPWDIVISTSDDMEFIKPGFDLDIIEDMTANFQDMDGVLHYGDGFQHGPILSLPIMGRKYFDRFGYIYHPSYQSLFCDEEALAVAHKLGKLYSGDRKLFRHNHPAWVPSLNDAQYKHTESFHPVDKRTFERRKAKNFFV